MNTTSSTAITNQTAPRTDSRRIPLGVKIAFTGFMAILVPVYWASYGPTNFLYFCDAALFLTLAAIWTGHPLPASMAAVGILLPQLVWVVDFACGCAGCHPIGLATYMFDPKIKLFARSLSLFHGWLPFLLIYLVSRLGYDRRALAGWTLLATSLMLTSYFFLPPPTPASVHSSIPVNIDYVFGFSDTEPQHWMNPHLWVTTLILAMPLCLYLPTHFLLRRLAPKAA